MDQSKACGIHGERQSLCLSCAERIYGSGLEKYMDTGDIHILSDKDRPAYAGKGLACDECLNWIFLPGIIQDPWWLVVPDQAEHIRLLVPFADFLESLQVDVLNLRSITIG